MAQEKDGQAQTSQDDEGDALAATQVGATLVVAPAGCQTDRRSATYGRGSTAITRIAA
jgi:hypothetical protein